MHLGYCFPRLNTIKAVEAHTQSGLPAPLQMLKQCAEHSDDPRIRFAALLLAAGEQRSRNEKLEKATAICERYRAPNEYTQLALIAIRTAETIGSDSATELLDVMEASSAFRDASQWQQLLNLFQATGHINAASADRLVNARQLAANISAASLEDKSLQGPAIGEAIRAKRRETIEQFLKT